MTRHHLTRAGAALLIFGATVATGSGPLGPHAIHAHAQPLADGKIMTLHMTTAARVFDMSPTGSQPPPGWMAPSFDDSSWDHVVTQPCGITNNNLGGSPKAPFHSPIPQPWGTSSPVWGPNAGDRYLFRQTFMVPKAWGYYGSVLAYTSTAVPGFSKLMLNGKALNGAIMQRQQIAVERYLHPGRNVLTVEFEPGGSCNSFDDAITLRMTGLQRPSPLVLSWQPVRNAARYDVQMWLVRPAPGQRITSDAEVNIALHTMGPRATLDDAAMPGGTYQWRTAAVDAHGFLISRWTPAQTVTLN